MCQLHVIGTSFHRKYFIVKANDLIAKKFSNSKNDIHWKNSKSSRANKFSIWNKVEVLNRSSGETVRRNKVVQGKQDYTGQNLCFQKERIFQSSVVKRFKSFQGQAKVSCVNKWDASINSTKAYPAVRSPIITWNRAGDLPWTRNSHFLVPNTTTKCLEDVWWVHMAITG